jgi:L-lactate dehydrogenase
LAHFGDPPDHALIASEVRDAGYRIISGKGYTSFGVATAIVRICEAIIRNERAVLPVSTLLTGEFGIADLYLSLPCLLSSGGVERILLPQLSPDEQCVLRRSAEVIRNALSELDLA